MAGGPTPYEAERALRMNAEAVVEALKALHVKTTWTWDEYWGADRRDGCATCGGGSKNRTTWPCETRRILDLAEKQRPVGNLSGTADLDDVAAARVAYYLGFGSESTND